MIYVICCNDGLMYATSDKLKADKKLEECKKLESRDGFLFWHIHKVEEI